MPTHDKYGGFAGVPFTGTYLRGPVGGWRTGRITQDGVERIVMVSPLGNVSIIKGVYKSGTWSGGVDNAGKRAFEYLDQKYGDHSWRASLGSARQVRDAGFNVQAQAVLFQRWPVAVSTSDPVWNIPRTYLDGTTEPNNTAPFQQPFPMVTVGFQHLSMYSGDPSQSSGRIAEPVKSLYAGRNATWVPISKGNAFCADVFDPKWPQFAESYIPGNIPYSTTWFPFVQFDDGDFVYGLGAGAQGHPNETGITPQSNQWGPHLAFVVLCGNPTITSGTSPRNGQAITYTDTVNHTKVALRDFLTLRYGTIGALNAAWGSAYTTFDSDGAWGVGNGLMDENGRHTAWLTGAINLRWADSTLWPAAVKQDLDDFLEKIADAYYSVCRAAADRLTPGALYQGPSYIGAWQAPARAPVIRSASKYVDLFSCQINYNFTQQFIDYVTTHLGPDIPILSWQGFPTSGNADSALYYVADNYDPTHQGQPNRAAFFRSINMNAFQLVAGPTGQRPYVGFNWWEHKDNNAELLNWGSVTPRDNPYDGQDYTVARPDPYDPSVTTIPEDHVYGDFLTPFKAAMVEFGDLVTGNITPPPPPPPPVETIRLDLTIQLEDQVHETAYTGMRVRFQNSQDGGQTWVDVQSNVRALTAPQSEGGPGTATDFCDRPASEGGQYRAGAVLTDGTIFGTERFSDDSADTDAPDAPLNLRIVNAVFTP